MKKDEETIDVGWKPVMINENCMCLWLDDCLSHIEDIDKFLNDPHQDCNTYKRPIYD